MNIANQLQNLMEKKKISRSRLAREIGVHTSTVSNWLDGKDVKSENLSILCSFFDCSMEYLLSGDLMDHVPPEQSTRGMAPEERTAYYQKNTPAETGRRIPYEEKREILAADGIRLHLDADVKLTDEQLEDIVDFIQFQQRKNDK